MNVLLLRLRGEKSNAQSIERFDGRRSVRRYMNIYVMLRSEAKRPRVSKHTAPKARKVLFFLASSRAASTLIFGKNAQRSSLQSGSMDTQLEDWLSAKVLKKCTE